MHGRHQPLSAFGARDLVRDRPRRTQLGWFYYFLVAGILVSGTCFLLYALCDRVEELVDRRDAEEAGRDVPAAPIVPEPQNGDSYAPRRI